MSKLLFYDKITDTKAKVTLIHSNPTVFTDTELTKGVIVEDIPVPEEITGSYSVLYINPQTVELHYEYYPIPLQLDIQQVNQKMDNLTIQLGDVLLGGAL
jgi:hypothetical protein